MEDWKKRIEDSAKDVEVPESLQPERINEKLGEKRKIRPFYRRPAVWTATAAAAVFLAVIGMREWNGSKMSGMAQDTASSQKADTTSSQEADTTSSQEADMASSQETYMAADTGASMASSEEGAEAVNGTLEEEPDANFSKYYHTVTYQELENQIKKAWEEQKSQKFGAEDQEADGARYEGSEEAASAEPEEAGISEQQSSENGAAEDADVFSSTNLQVEGVDEGDIVKTDGTYLYILSQDSRVQIVDAKKMKIISEISDQTDGENVTYKEMYVSDGRLILAGNQYESSLEESAEDVYYMDSSNKSVLVTYDLSEIEKPKLIGKVSQDGYYRTSRKVGNTIYLFSDYFCFEEEASSGTSLIPRINGVEVPEGQIYVPNTISQCRYLVMSSINVEKPNQIKDKKALMNSGEEFYITKSSIYVILYEWNYGEGGDQIYSNFVRFKMEDGKIRAASAVSLKGQLTDTFAVSEYGGYLRVFLTDWNEASNDGPINRVYVVDNNMEVCGKIENLAPGETIYSARFMGDKGYFVTYRNTDPLFSVDFSDPNHPEILGELKVTGFSEYLHFYGNDKLFGLGWETDPNTGQVLGLKLSMYDIGNPKDVKEANKLVLKDIDQCDALYEYKAVLIDPEKNLIGFSVGSYGDDEYHQKYVVFSYKETEGFVKKMEFDTGDTIYAENRGVYIGHILYVAGEQRIAAFDMNNEFEAVGSLELDGER